MAAFTRSYVLEEYRKLYHRRARKGGHKAVVERIEKVVERIEKEELKQDL
jgi:hypothetical protein